VCWRGDATRVERVGGRCCIVTGGKCNEEKKLKIKYIVALDGRRQINHTQQSTKNMPVQQRRDRRGDSTGMERATGKIN
jgi:hypothetical protein